MHEELVHTTSDAKEQAASRVAELKTSKLIADRQLTSQRDLLSKATAKVDQLTKVVAKLEDEKTGALAVTGEAVKDMEASGRRDEERSTEITQLREVLIVKVAECDRLQALQLTGPGAADPLLPAKLLATETYLKQCTDAFHNLKASASLELSWASREVSDLSLRLSACRIESDNFERQLLAAQREAVRVTQQLSLSQVDLAHAQQTLKRSRSHNQRLS